MDKLIAFLMILLFTVAICNSAIFKSDGIQNDAMSMKTNTQNIVKDANDAMTEYGNSN